MKSPSFCEVWTYKMGPCDLAPNHRGLHFVRNANGTYSWWGVIER